MSTTEMPKHFVEQFSDNVMLRYAEGASKLSNCCRNKNNIVGESASFNLSGGLKFAEKTKFGKIQLADDRRDRVKVFPQFRFTGVKLDDIDMVQIGHDERPVVEQRFANAGGEWIDDTVFKAMDAGRNTAASHVTGGATAAPIPTLFLEAQAALEGRDVPTGDAKIYCAVTPLVWAHLMTFKSFSNADYVDDQPWQKNLKMRDWLGVNFFKTNRVPKTENAVRCMMWHHDAVGLGIWKLLRMEAGRLVDEACDIITAKIFAGAVVIQPDGVQTIEVNQAAALPAAP